MWRNIGKNIVIPQWISGIGVTILLVQLGITAGFVSPMLATFTTPGSMILLNPAETSWVASLSNLGRFCGAIVGSIFTTFFGTRKSILITSVPLALGWLGIALAGSVELIYAARILMGIGVGMAYGCFPLYLGEISMPEIRGALVSLAASGMPFGQLLGSVATSYLGVEISCYIYFALCILAIVIFLTLPDSPHYLVKRGNEAATRKAIDWYRSGRGVDDEFAAVKKFVATESEISFVDRLREFRKRENRKALLQIITLFIFMQICGMNSVIFYMEIILVRAKLTIVNPTDIVVYINCSGALAAVASIFIIDRYGRKFLLLISSAGATISMIGMMSHFFLIDMNYDVTDLQWLPLLSMFLYIVSLFIGLLPVPSTILSETFPANTKCIAASIASFTGGLFAFISSKTYQPMVDMMGETYVFLVYAVLAFLVIPYTILALRETKGKSLMQIQEELQRK